MKHREDADSDRILVFPKGTIVKFDGLPCKLLQDTNYECKTIRVRSRNTKNNSKGKKEMNKQCDPCTEYGVSSYSLGGEPDETK